MWNSGQAAAAAPSWGWPAHPAAYQYNNQGYDSSQNWAAAAALWAQQRKIQEQYQHSQVQYNEKPPEPPGPPPSSEQSLPPLPPQPVEESVFDYNHGQTKSNLDNIQTVDYQHGKANDHASADVFDYNHGKSEDNMQQSSWQQSNTPDQHIYNQNYENETWEKNGYNAEWNNHQWQTTEWNNQQSSNWTDSSWTSSNWNNDHARQYSDQASYENSPEVVTKRDEFHTATKKKTPFTHVNVQSLQDAAAELSKKSKALPLWLRQGLEKMEKEKQKKSDKDIPNPKQISGYQHGSPVMSAGSDKSDSESETEDMTKQRKSREKSRSRSPRNKHVRKRTPDKRDVSPEKGEASENEEDELDDEERQRLKIMKIRTWMTDILLGVTNEQIRSIANEVYFEMKRSAKSKATLVRKSGGLDALRLAGLGGEDETTDESDNDEDLSHASKLTKQTAATVNTYSKPREREQQNVIKSNREKDKLSQSRSDSEDEKNSKLEFSKKRSPGRIVSSENKRKAKVSSAVEQNYDTDSVEEIASSKTSKSKKKRSRKEEKDISTSSESDESRHKKKSKRRRSRTRSRTPSKKKSKKSSRSRHRSCSSSDEENERTTSRRKKQKRHYSTESESDSSTYHRKKSSKGKKYKHKSRSPSRSPSRRRQKKKR